MQHDPYLVSRRRAAVLASGVDAAETRSALWTRGLHGVLRPTWWVHDPLTTRIGDAVALMSDANALGGWAALRAWGNEWFDGTRADGSDRPVLVHCLPGSQLRARPGIRPSQSAILPDETVRIEGYRLATIARAAFDEMCTAPGLREAVVVADMAASTTTELPRTTLRDIARVEGSHHKVRGIVQVRRALALATSRSASPLETRTRLVWHLDADLGPVGVNVPVFDGRGRLAGVADLLDEDAGLVVESDGADAHGRDRRDHDHDREERFERAGLVVCRVGPRHHRDRYALAARLREARRDAASRPRGTWTTTKPTWWPTWTHAPRWD